MHASQASGTAVPFAFGTIPVRMSEPEAIPHEQEVAPPTGNHVSSPSHVTEGGPLGRLSISESKIEVMGLELASGVLDEHVFTRRLESSRVAA